jgi:hypothetical protein
MFKEVKTLMDHTKEYAMAARKAGKMDGQPSVILNGTLTPALSRGLAGEGIEGWEPFRFRPCCVHGGLTQ